MVARYRFVQRMRNLDRRSALAKPYESSENSAVAAIQTGSPILPAGFDSRRKDQFLQALTHELRTPITTIFGSAQLAVEPGISTRTQREAMLIVARESQRLARLVEDLLVLARQPQPTDLMPSVVRLPKVVTPIVKARRSGLEGAVSIVLDTADDAPAVIADRDRLVHVLHNLLDGALRANPAGGTVTIGIQPAAGGTAIVLEDGGPPWGQRDAARAFDLFADSPRARTDPSGINLTMFVAGVLTRSMGGTIEAGNTERGARIRATFPASQAA